MAVVTCNTYKTLKHAWSEQDEWVTLTYDFAQDTGLAADTHRMAAVTGKILVKEAIVHVEICNIRIMLLTFSDNILF